MNKRELTFRRAFKDLAHRQEPPLDLDWVKRYYVGFVQKLLRRYPFQFCLAHRGVSDEKHRWAAERLATQFLFGSLAEGVGIEEALVEKNWELAAHLGKMVRRGGENFWPQSFDESEKLLARRIGETTFELLLQREKELAHKIKFNLGPINPVEHTIAWSFRYVRQLLGQAKWESRNGFKTSEQTQETSAPNENAGRDLQPDLSPARE